jgi:hypothetical protein
MYPKDDIARANKELEFCHKSSKICQTIETIFPGKGQATHENAIDYIKDQPYRVLPGK